MAGLTNKFVTFWLPWRWLSGGRIEFVEQQTKRFFAGESIARKQRTIAYGELDFDVETIC